MEIISIIISIIALTISAVIGVKQVKLSKMQAEMQNKVELYLLFNSIVLRDTKKEKEDSVLPAIYIRNIGNNVIYLDSYIFNGKKYPLGKEVLPPVAAFDGFHFIYLPTDGTYHVSFEIYFYDWQNNPWKTVGYADLRNGVWEITYSPCEKIKEKA